MCKADSKVMVCNGNTCAHLNFRVLSLTSRRSMRRLKELWAANTRLERLPAESMLKRGADKKATMTHWIRTLLLF